MASCYRSPLDLPRPGDAPTSARQFFRNWQTQPVNKLVHAAWEVGLNIASYQQLLDRLEIEFLTREERDFSDPMDRPQVREVKILRITDRESGHTTTAEF